jgi:hypothetical protein
MEFFWQVHHAIIQRDFLQYANPRSLTFWIYDLDITSCCWVKVWQGKDCILGIEKNENDYLYQWKFIPLGLKNAPNFFKEWWIKCL